VPPDLRADGEPPVNLTKRRALRDTEVAGEPVAAGETVVPVIVAANRDPRRFPDPDRFDITRADNAPLSFGGGIHFCLGAALARVEAEIAQHGLARRFPGLTLVDNEIQWRETIAFREAVAVVR
jgi:cytochrome P450